MKKGKNNLAVIGRFTGKCCDGTVDNNNGMFLSKELFNILLNSDEFKRAMKNRYYIGFLGHPEDPGCMDFEHACIIMTECHMDDDGQVYGTFDLVDTPVGRIVKAFIDAGVTFGISIRGAGDVGPDGEVDPDTFVFRGFDLVTFPAYDDAVPVFEEIAASSDLDKQVKYKKVCSTVNKNLKNITSSTTLDTIQEQFKENSDEYEAIEDRKSELSEDTSTEDTLREQIAGMTSLYLEQIEANNQLRRELHSTQHSLVEARSNYDRRLQSIRRIGASQLDDITQELDNVTQLHAKAVSANKRINSQLKKLKSDNLKYVHKIEASSKIISEREQTISSLQAKLRKTVTANSKLKSGASNRDAEVETLRAKIEASEQMVMEYQQAFANMYANALGLYLENIQITASTSVAELKDMIASGTSTTNISTALVEPEPVEIQSDMDDDVDIITM